MPDLYVVLCAATDAPKTENKKETAHKLMRRKEACKQYVRESNYDGNIYMWILDFSSVCKSRMMLSVAH